MHALWCSGTRAPQPTGYTEPKIFRAARDHLVERRQDALEHVDSALSIGCRLAVTSEELVLGAQGEAEEQVLFAGEVEVQGALRETRALRHFFHGGGVESLVGEHFLGRIQNAARARHAAQLTNGRLTGGHSHGG